jgi:hypothetical protein
LAQASLNCGVACAGLGRRRLLLGIDADVFPRASFVLEFHYAVDKGEQSIVLAATDILAWFPLRATLPREDVSTLNVLTAKLFQAQTLRL